MTRPIVGGLILLGLFAFTAQSSSKATNAPVMERPLIVNKDQGEVRTWRPLQRSDGWEKISFTIKVDKQNGGSPDFWFVTESLPPGVEIGYHRHLHQDEVLYIGSGVARVHVGSLVGDARAGSIVFIPRNTWVSVKNVGKVPIALLVAFNAPGFDRYMRCESEAPGQPAQPLSVQEDLQCDRLGDVQYR